MNIFQNMNLFQNMNMNKILIIVVILIVIFILIGYILRRQYYGYYDYSCHYKRYGCCPDGLLPKYDQAGSNCYK